MTLHSRAAARFGSETRAALYAIRLVAVFVVLLCGASVATGMPLGLLRELTADDGAAGDGYGIALDIDDSDWSQGGLTAVVGAYAADVGGNEGQGAAYVLERDQGGTSNWGVVKKLVAPDGAAGERFGRAVAIYRDTVAVGAWQATVDGHPGQGAVYFFNRDVGGTNNWGFTAKVTASDGSAYDYFGWALAYYFGVLVVGAYGDDDNGSASGSAYIFYGATQLKKISAYPDSAAGDNFGYSVSLYGDALAVGAPQDDVGANADQGSVHVFRRDQGGADNWGEVKKITAADGAAGDQFGLALSLSGRLLVGAPYDDDNGNASGSAYLFARDEGGTDNWGQLKKLTASDAAANDHFGLAVASGWYAAVVGAGGDDVGGSADQGSAYVFRREEGGAENWGEAQKLTAPDGAAHDAFGWAVSLDYFSSNVAMVGAYAASAIQGAAYLYAPSACPDCPTWRIFQEIELGDGSTVFANLLYDHVTGNKLNRPAFAAYPFAEEGELPADAAKFKDVFVRYEVPLVMGVGTITWYHYITTPSGQLIEIRYFYSRGTSSYTLNRFYSGVLEWSIGGAGNLGTTWVDYTGIAFPTPGNITHRIVKDGVEVFNRTYTQRKLVLTQNLLDLTFNRGDPVPFSNLMAWDTTYRGEPAPPIGVGNPPVAGESPAYTVTLSDPLGPVAASGLLIGPTVNWTWNSAAYGGHFADLGYTITSSAVAYPAADIQGSSEDARYYHVLGADLTLQFCGNGATESGEQCDDANSVNGDGCDNNCTLTACGNGILTSGEACDDGNVADADGCDADCTWTGLLPEIDDTPPLPGKADSASLNCMKAVGAQARTYASAVYDRLRACLNAVQEYNTRVAAGLSSSQITSALAAAERQCVEPRAAAADAGTMLGKLEAARLKAVSAMEKKCGAPGATALDGKAIGNEASADFTRAAIEEHLSWARCQAEELFGRGYATASADLHGFTARASQGGQSLDSYFPCLGSADLAAMDYTPSAPGKKDAASVSCQKTVGAQVRGYARRRHLLLRNCLDALLAHQAAQTAGAPAGQIQKLLSTAVKKCVEPSATAKDKVTLLGKLEAARLKAVSAIETKCGTPGDTALDGKAIGAKASADLTQAEVIGHLDSAACKVDDVVSRGYDGAAELLETLTARASQGGGTLDTYFACLLR